jgi:pyrroloquinoline quinone biosynthesis protein D
MGPESRPSRREQVLAQSAGETMILLTPASGEYFTLNEVGARIWELADGSRSAREIAEVLVGEYEAPLEAIEADTLELLAELEERELLVADPRN